MMKIIVGLSGGVDSSVAALLLKRQGYDVEALYMRNWDSAINNDLLGNPDLGRDVCPQEEDYLDAVRVAESLGIKLHRHDFVDEYWQNVFSVFLSELRQGRTPNPDILCNKHIKFSAFLQIAKSLGADKIAMGHYARTTATATGTWLLRGVDRNKDQSYFLCQLTQSQLESTLFPIGELNKTEVRKIAEAAGMLVAGKKDSTGICFIGERHFSAFIANYLPAKPGAIIAHDKTIIGTHEGLMYYTIGQRRGLHIGGSRKYGNDPWFVTGKDLSRNELYLAQGYDHPLLYSNRCILTDINWINEAPAARSPLSAKFRYRQRDVQVTLTYLPDQRVQVCYPSTSRAVTPGQACVVYDGEVCLGGGTIAAVFMNDERRHEGDFHA